MANKRTSPTNEAGQVEGIRACWLCLDFFQQTHNLEVAQPYLLQCDRLFQPWFNNQVEDNVGLER